MQKITTALAVLLLTMPSVSFAAALTQQQANSLIAVVQSSPGTPASAFVSLITAFSNITTTQASSLITVVQAAPGVPANAFVDLLTSFTVDIPTTQLATPTPITEPTTTIPITPAPTAIVEPSVGKCGTCIEKSVLAMKAITINEGSYHSNKGVASYYTIDVFYNKIGVPITISAPEGIFESQGKKYALTATQNSHDRVGGIGVYDAIGANFTYTPLTRGNRIITVTVDGISETKELRGELSDGNGIVDLSSNTQWVYTGGDLLQ